MGKTLYVQRLHKASEGRNTIQDSHKAKNRKAKIHKKKGEYKVVDPFRHPSTQTTQGKNLSCETHQFSIKKKQDLRQIQRKDNPHQFGS